MTHRSAIGADGSARLEGGREAPTLGGGSEAAQRRRRANNANLPQLHLGAILFMLASALFCVRAFADPVSPMTSIALHCGAPDPSKVSPEPETVMTELAQRFASTGWRPLGHNATPKGLEEHLAAISEADLAPHLVFADLPSPNFSGYQAGTTSGRGVLADQPAPRLALFTHESGALLFATAFRYKSNEGIDLRCTGFGKDDDEENFLNAFKPQSIMSILREKRPEARYVTTSLKNSAFPKSGPGYRWGQVNVALINAEAISQDLERTFPFTLRIETRSYLLPPNR